MSQRSVERILLPLTADIATRMIQNMEDAVLYRPVSDVDEYQKQTVTLRRVDKILVMISVKTSAPGLVNNVRTQNSTHIGTTESKDVRPQDMIWKGGEWYRVESVTCPRLTVLELTKQQELMPHEDKRKGRRDKTGADG